MVKDSSTKWLLFSLRSKTSLKKWDGIFEDKGKSLTLPWTMRGN